MTTYAKGRERGTNASTIVPLSTADFVEKNDELYVADYHSQDIKIKPVKPAPKVGGRKKLAGKKPATIPQLKQTHNPFAEEQRQQALMRRVMELAADPTYSTD